MSLMINGKLQDNWFDAVSSNGKYVRKDSQFRTILTPAMVEPGRYHLYVSYACPWAHRTLIFRQLKKLQNIISVSVVHPYMDSQGWHFADDFPGATGDSLYHCQRMHEIYTMARPDYSGIVTVPVLWDKKQQTIVNNESADIIRMFNTVFNDVIEDRQARELDLYPEENRQAIDNINQLIYDNVNNAVYQCGFATSQSAYEEAFHRLFATLDKLESILSQQRYLTGDRITEADWRLFVTLIRFDVVYVCHFKCNKKRISDYPNLHDFMLELYQWPGIAETTFIDHVKHHYYRSHDNINPSGIIPAGPELNLQQPHHRSRL